MATETPIEVDNLQTDIDRIKKELKDKQDKLEILTNTDINKLVDEFIKEVEKKGLKKALVKKAIVERLTKPRIKKTS